MPRDVLSEMPVREVLQPESDKTPVKLAGSLDVLTRQASEAMKGLGALDPSPARPPLWDKVFTTSTAKPAKSFDFNDVVIGFDPAAGPDHSVVFMIEKVTTLVWAEMALPSEWLADHASLSSAMAFQDWKPLEEPVPPANAEIRDVLLRAADLIEREGYHRGALYGFERQDGSRYGASAKEGSTDVLVGRCAVGALADAAREGMRGRRRMITACLQAMRDVVGDSQVWRWSDAQGTGAPVVAALRQAAANLV